jgi:hypothetical protein
VDLAAARQHLAEQSRKTFGEDAKVMPGNMGDERWEADPSRPAFDVIIHPVFSTGDETSLAGGRTNGWMARLAIGPASVEVDFIAYPAALSTKAKDRLTLTARNATFEIARVDRQGRDRLVWSLVRI